MAKINDLIKTARAVSKREPNSTAESEAFSDVWAELAGLVEDGWSAKHAAAIKAVANLTGSTPMRVQRAAEAIANYQPPTNSADDFNFGTSGQPEQPDNEADQAESDQQSNGGDQPSEGTDSDQQSEGTDSEQPSEGDGGDQQSEGQDEVLNPQGQDGDSEQDESEGQDGDSEQDESEGQDGDSEQDESDSESGQNGSASLPDDSPVLALTGPREALDEVLDLATAWPGVRALTPDEWAQIMNGDKPDIETLPRPVDEGSGEPQRDLVADLAACLTVEQTAYVWGPPGAGKSWACRAAAERLGLPVYEVELGRMSSDLDMKGYMNGYGTYVRTAARDAFEGGGVLVLNELDNVNADVLVAVQSFVECVPGVTRLVFPDGVVTAHKDFRLLTTGNTNGRGGTIGFESREALDLSSLDRMAYFTVGYSRAHDLELAGEAGKYLVSALWRLREAANKLHLDHVFTPRSILKAKRLLMAERWTWAQILDMAYLTHMSDDDREAIKRAAPEVWSLA